MSASTILLLETDAPAGDAVVEILSGAGYTVNRTGDKDEAVARAGEHHLVIIDVVDGRSFATEICSQIRATPALAQIPVLCISAVDDVEERIRFLEAGADDVITRPFEASELEARVESLLLRFHRSKDLVPMTSAGKLTLGRARRSVAVYSPKGGVGTTTIATNVAVAAAVTRPDRVVLVDLAQFGGVATHLNLRPRQTIADLVRDDSALREPELLRSYAVRHDSGLHVLAAPVAPEASETITPGHVGRIMATLLDGYDLVVVDAGSALDERVLTVFEGVETVILPIYPEIAALRAMHALLEYLTATGSVWLKAMFVLNNAFAREILKLRDVESALGSKVAFELPYDTFLYLKAVNEGIPIVVGAARSVAAERLVQLSESAFGGDGLVAPVAALPRKSVGLFGRRR